MHRIIKEVLTDGRFKKKINKRDVGRAKPVK